MGVYFENSRVLTTLPSYISTLKYIPPEIVNGVYNFYQTDRNPLILPFQITVEAFYHGTCTFGTFSGKTQTINVGYSKDTAFKFSCDFCLTWWIYGTFNQQLFNQLLDSQLTTENFIMLDALLHTLPFEQAVVLAYQNPLLWDVVKEDWQFEELGFADFIKMKMLEDYDKRKVALFYTIMNYVNPSFLQSIGVPLSPHQNPEKTFIYYYLMLEGNVLLLEELQTVVNLIKIGAEFESEVQQIITQFGSEGAELLSEIGVSVSETVQQVTSEVTNFIILLENETLKAIHKFYHEIKHLQKFYSETLPQLSNELIDLLNTIRSEISNLQVPVILTKHEVHKFLLTLYSYFKKLYDKGSHYVIHSQNSLNKIVNSIIFLYSEILTNYNVLTHYISEFPNDITQFLSEVPSIMRNVMSKYDQTSEVFYSIFSEILSTFNSFYSDYISVSEYVCVQFSSPLPNYLEINSELNCLLNTSNSLINSLINVVGELLSTILNLVLSLLNALLSLL